MTNTQMVWTILAAMSGQAALIITVLVLVVNAKISGVHKRLDDLIPRVGSIENVLMQKNHIRPEELTT
jgi:ABC-type tungstate transport system substrate-binding protein